eukprot:533166-Pleurochrysis_carterae.AAC.1
MEHAAESITQCLSRFGQIRIEIACSHCVPPRIRALVCRGGMPRRVILRERRIEKLTDNLVDGCSICRQFMRLKPRWRL